MIQTLKEIAQNLADVINNQHNELEKMFIFLLLVMWLFVTLPVLPFYVVFRHWEKLKTEREREENLKNFPKILNRKK